MKHLSQLRVFLFHQLPFSLKHLDNACQFVLESFEELLLVARLVPLVLRDLWLLVELASGILACLASVDLVSLEEVLDDFFVLLQRTRFCFGCYFVQRRETRPSWFNGLSLALLDHFHRFKTVPPCVNISVGGEHLLHIILNIFSRQLIAHFTGKLL